MTSRGSVRGPGGNAKDVALVRDGSRVYVERFGQAKYFKVVFVQRGLHGKTS